MVLLPCPLVAQPGEAQQNILPAEVDLSGLRWRMIGPFRGGRSIAVSGIESQPNTYYFGGVGGGVWKTANGGNTWTPIFDSQPIASIGAIAVAPSDPGIIYVGTGEADFRSDLTYGNGVYKSTDGGNTWSNIGLRETRHIARIIVDPKNPNIVLVAALGHAYGPNPERGVFRSTDGGGTWQKVLFKDENTGAIDLRFDPDNPQTVYAALWSARRPPWSTYPPISSSGAIWKSTDGGATWKQLTGSGLPEGDWGRVGLGIARGTHGQRIYALIDVPKGCVFRSDDGGQNWTLVSNDERICQRIWYFGEVTVDPKDPDTVYLPSVSIYRSKDAGKNFEAIKGAPGGDDYHTLWIDPANPERMIFGSDQGAGVSVDGGKTWSSWYNQPTAQFYHVAVDNQFPYRVYGAQQDSGTISTSSRSDFGSITFRDWYAIGAGESGYIAPDPNDPNIVYGGDTYGGLHRFDHRTGQSQTISPSAIRSFGEIARAELRFTWTSPLVFSPQDSHVLYFGSQYLLRSTNQGMSWEKISPDLTGAQTDVARAEKPTIQNAKPQGYGVIYTIAPSIVAAGQIWVGTDSGLIHLTRDGGKTWTNVTPKGLSDWSKISVIEASHFDASVAYAAVDRHRLDDAAPYIYVTHDFGKTWGKITKGIPDGAYVRAVREAPSRRGLLFAGTELGVYFSLDDGDSWQSLRLNMPVAPVHDLAIKDNDLIAATHGRAFWILDDFSPLSQMELTNINGPLYLFAPSPASRIRSNVNNDTPLPPEVPAGENPPPGAILYYYLKSPAQGDVTLEIQDSSHKMLRRFSSSDQPFEPKPNSYAFPSYWFKPPEKILTSAGVHRFVWDLRYPPPAVPHPEFGMNTAAGQNTPVEPLGPLALPGTYYVKLNANGRNWIQRLFITMDPRVKTSAEDLQKQFELEMTIDSTLQQGNAALNEIRTFYAQNKNNPAMAQKLQALSRIEPSTGDSGPRRPDRPPTPTLSRYLDTLGRLAVTIDSADAAPTSQATKAAGETVKQLQGLVSQWEKLKQ
ncbi:MAG TPA: hypothetical protein VFR24_09920 [Candidatus Angelobacter sp.]|nr:hypothetical protein [Candidatus Angelobacter sp.]